MNYTTETTPSARLREFGTPALSDAELIAVITSRPLAEARAILGEFGSLRALCYSAPEALGSHATPTAVDRLRAVAELRHRIDRESVASSPIASPEVIYDLMRGKMDADSQESVQVILLNHRKCLIRVIEIFRGTGNECFANPSEILRAAISNSAHALVLVHNHPSGDPSPSQADHEVTRRLRDACRAVGIQFTDHVIIGKPSDDHGPFFSFRESGLI